jgi:hypothetical protein
MREQDLLPPDKIWALLTIPEAGDDEERLQKLAEMKPFRRISGAATRQRIRSTLRADLNLAVTRRCRGHRSELG